MGFLEDTLGDSPIVAAVKDEPGLERCLNSPCRVVFVLFGDLNSVPRIVDRAENGGQNGICARRPDTKVCLPGRRQWII